MSSVLIERVERRAVPSGELSDVAVSRSVSDKGVILERNLTVRRIRTYNSYRLSLS